MITKGEIGLLFQNSLIVLVGMVLRRTVVGRSDLLFDDLRLKWCKSFVIGQLRLTANNITVKLPNQFTRSRLIKTRLRTTFHLIPMLTSARVVISYHYQKKVVLRTTLNWMLA